MPLTHKSSPFMKRYRLPSLKYSSSNVTRTLNYDDLSSPEEEQSEKMLSQILKSKKEVNKLNSPSKNDDVLNIPKKYIEIPSISLLQQKKEEKSTMNIDNECSNNNNNNQEKPLKTDVENDTENKNIKEMEKVIYNEIENLKKRFKELELLMKF